MPTQHSTTSHCTSFREEITLNTQLADLQEAKSSSWSTPVKICSTVMINLYPAQRVLFLLIVFFLDVSYILLQVLIFSQPSASPFVYRTHPFLSPSLTVTLGFLVFILLEKTPVQQVTVITFLWLISKSLILSYPTTFLKSCSEQNHVFCIACVSPSPNTNHNFSCLHLSLHCFL